AGTSDLNDMPSFATPSDGAGTLRVRFGGVERSCSLAQARGATSRGDSATLELCWDELAPADPVAPLAKDDAKRVRDELVAARRAELRTERAAEVEAKVLTLGDKSLRWLERSFGDAPEGERSLWISLHGGGGAPVEVNDGQWKNQIQLYEPAEGIYVAPRAPTDTWNLWHEGHVDPLFARLIEDFVALRGVDPERVYLLGYSAGGDGVWQLAPRIADRFAAAAMMAGHPNEASLLGLRNLPFAIFMGAEDAAYDRNRIAKERAGELDALRSADADGYEHFVRIYPGLGHWMERKDAEALPWMADRRRVSWPKRVVWFQDDVVHERFYWLGRATGAARAGEHVVAEVDGQRVRIDSHGARGLELWLSDELLDLDLPIVVERDGAVVFEGRVPRDPNVLRAELARSFDPKLAACARLSLAD
ncbi:MAG: dienelactone hydrolase family protein, partial [Planctomycetes bacterium]|nr:dienelactone hydrolase family protein [Planctomycetota bacterium]